MQCPSFIVYIASSPIAPNTMRTWTNPSHNDPPQLLRLRSKLAKTMVAPQISAEQRAIGKTTAAKPFVISSLEQGLTFLGTSTVLYFTFRPQSSFVLHLQAAKQLV